MIYIASPYSHEDDCIRALRYKQVLQHCNTRMLAGELVFSPIVYGHTFEKEGMVLPYGYWINFCMDMLFKCKECCVLQLPGWHDSKGVSTEIVACGLYSIPVEYRME